ncbi:sugar transferase, partial [Rhizobium ruizarguesonis]
VFFRQIRWGLNGRKITFFNFRSMRAEACDPSCVQQTVKGDNRVTGIGAVLRKTNIDELPQRPPAERPENHRGFRASRKPRRSRR